MVLVIAFGGLLGKKDRLAFDVCAELSKDLVLKKKFDFDFSSSPDLMVKQAEKNKIVIVDVVKNLDKVQEITDIDQLESNGSVSAHDFDLAFYLLLLQRLGNTKNISVIGIPYGCKKSKAVSEVQKILLDFNTIPGIK